METLIMYLSLAFSMSDNFCLLIWYIRPFTFNMIINMVEVKSTILLFVLYFLQSLLLFPLFLSSFESVEHFSTSFCFYPEHVKYTFLLHFCSNCLWFAKCIFTFL